MNKIITFENNKFKIIPDPDKDFIIYVLVGFDNGNLKKFEVNNYNYNLFLEVSTVKIPNGFWGYGFQSNFLDFSDTPVNGFALNDFKTELEALQGCLQYVKNSFRWNKIYTDLIISEFETFVNSKTLFPSF